MDLDPVFGSLVVHVELLDEGLRLRVIKGNVGVVVSWAWVLVAEVLVLVQVVVLRRFAGRDLLLVVFRFLSQLLLCLQKVVGA